MTFRGSCKLVSLGSYSRRDKDFGSDDWYYSDVRPFHNKRSSRRTKSRYFVTACVFSGKARAERTKASTTGGEFQRDVIVVDESLMDPEISSVRDCETCVFLQPLPATVQTSY